MLANPVSLRGISCTKVLRDVLQTLREHLETIHVNRLLETGNGCTFNRVILWPEGMQWVLDASEHLKG